jgi:hypothetical protein
VSGVLRVMLLAVGAGAVGLQVAHVSRNWGATAEEAAAVLPGDQLVPEPAEQTTLAVSVDAPAEEIWAWLVQIGLGRGGMYSYDWLETSSACRSTVRTRSAKTGSTSRSATVSCWSRQASPA